MQLVLCITIEVKLDHGTPLEVVLSFLGSLCLPTTDAFLAKEGLTNTPFGLAQLTSISLRTKGMPEKLGSNSICYDSLS